jgi:hypothetical protein
LPIRLLPSSSIAMPSRHESSERSRQALHDGHATAMPSCPRPKQQRPSSARAPHVSRAQARGSTILSLVPLPFRAMHMHLQPRCMRQQENVVQGTQAACSLWRSKGYWLAVVWFRTDAHCHGCSQKRDQVLVRGHGMWAGAGVPHLLLLSQCRGGGESFNGGRRGGI